MQRDFEMRFEYDETDDQLRCSEEIKHDMEKTAPMDRLLCGDVGFGKTEEDASKEKVMKALSEFLRPEFIARVDEVIVFNSLKKDDFVKIADLMLSEYVPTLEEKHIKFTFDEKVCQLLAEKSCNGASGARDLRNTIRREVEEKIANAMIEAGAGGVTAMHLTAENGEPVLQSI